MRISAKNGARLRLVTVIAFLASCAIFFGYLWVKAGGSVPGVASSNGYHVYADVADIDNLVPFSDVQIAGVGVGKVVSTARHGSDVRVELRLDGDVAPLHSGLTVQVSEKSLAGQSYVRVVDGTGRPMASGTVLPSSAVKPSVQLHDVLAALDAKTRAALGSTIRSLGAGTAGTADDTAALMQGLGKLGNSGQTALDAIAAQSADLQSVVNDLGVIFGALGTGQDDFENLVRNGQSLVNATAGQRTALAATVARLPGVLSTARTASTSLVTLAGNLEPVATNLRAAVPNLDIALEQLPQTTADLRGLLPSLNGALAEAPTTLDAVPTLATDVQALIPQLQDRLQDVNPMLGYLAPYGRDLGAFIANFHAAFSQKSPNGDSVLRLYPLIEDQTVRGLPALPGSGLISGSNGYPAPGAVGHLTPFTGAYPRLVPEPK